VLASVGIVTGLWLLLNVLVINLKVKRLRFFVEVSRNACVGASLALFAPVIPLRLLFSILILAGPGMFLGACLPLFMVIILAICMGAFLGGVVSHLVVCVVQTIPPWLRVLIVVIAVLLVVLACSVPYKEFTFYNVLIPAWGALLFTLGLQTLAFEGPDSGLTIEDVFRVPSLCTTNFTYAAECWACTTFCGILLHVVKVCYFQPKRDDSLLSLKNPLTAGDRGTPEVTDRHLTLTRAIYAEEDADYSHLTENERKIVKICQEDPEERDRVLFGGGLY